MWRYISNKILRNRLAFIIIIALSSAYMAYEGCKIQMSYELAKVLPATDSAYIEYANFKQKFGEDGSIMVLGFQDKDIFNLEKFQSWYQLNEDVKNIEGVKDIMSFTKIYNVVRNDSIKKFELKLVFPSIPKTQQELDSLKQLVYSLPFYDGIIYNKETNATLLAITFDKNNLNSKSRIDIVHKIKNLGKAFADKYNIKLHFSGMPYIRTEISEIVSSEMKMFLFLAILVTAIILYAFFRSFWAVLFSLFAISFGVIWGLGTMSLFQYKINMLTGLIPSLIAIIAVPNCIFLINKYHQEYTIHKNQIKALARTIQTIGVSLFLANITTAIGFGVFYFTNSQLLVEFGIVSALNVMITYIITLIIIPIFLSFLPVPTVKQTKHLNFKFINKSLQFVDYLSHNHRKLIYAIIGIVTAISCYGMYNIQVIGYVVDDLPEKHPLYDDLHFFEKNFGGILPFEISIDTKKKNGVFSNGATTLYKIKALQKVIASYPEFSKPISLTEMLRFSYQAYKYGNPKYYILPAVTELNKLSDYTSSVDGYESKIRSFMDSTKQQTRISVQMADVGSIRLKEIVQEIRTKVDSIFNPDIYKVEMTGQCTVFLKSNDYLLKNLFESLIIEIILIALVGMTLFRSVRIIILSKLPCLIPLIITGGIMGFVGIDFKPSTILIFTIAFGISSDGTIYFLTKYRQELRQGNKTISEAVSATIKETGISMIYTSIILFCGFAIFAASSFGGTASLGIMISITLLVSMFTNLLLLPSILLSLEKVFSKKEITEEPLIDIDEAGE